MREMKVDQRPKSMEKMANVPPANCLNGIRKGLYASITLVIMCFIAIL